VSDTLVSPSLPGFAAPVALLLAPGRGPHARLPMGGWRIGLKRAAPRAET
jgi:hypothetical protein